MLKPLAVVALVLFSAAPLAQTDAPADSWSVGVRKSAMDGDSIIAHRFAPSEIKSLAFLESVTCVEKTKMVSVSVQSLKMPGNADGTFATIPYVTSLVDMTLKGRVKFDGDEPSDLGAAFVVDPDDRAMMHLNLVDQGIKKQPLALTDPILAKLEIQPSSTAMFKVVPNYAAMLEQRLPLSIEVANDLGTFEFSIEATPEVVRVLDACNGKAGVFAPDAPPGSDRFRQNAAMPDDDLKSAYAAAVTNALTPNWLRPDNMKGTSCAIVITQAEGGQITDAKIDPDHCDFDEAGQRSAINAVRRSAALPYKGFESVWQAHLTFTLRPQ